MTDSKVQALARKVLETQLPAGTPAEQVRAILERPDAEGYVQSLNPQVLYQLVQRAGLDDAGALVAMANPWQVQVCFDLDLWAKDRFQTGRVIPWFQSLLQEASDEQFRRICRETDGEVLAMVFKENLLVGLFDEDGLPPAEFNDIDWTTSPDGVYAVAYPEDEDAGATIRAVLDRLYDVDRVMAWTLLEAARWELFSNMEEEELRWRNSRLEEFGFVGRDEAIEIYRVVDPTVFREKLEEQPLEDKRFDRMGRTDLPAIATPDDAGFYLLRILESLDVDLLEPLVTELVALQNRVLIADGVEPGDAEDASDGVARALGTLSLGLEYLSRGDDERATELVRSVPFRDVFRVGYSLLWKLRSTVQRLAQRPTLTLIETQRFSLLGDDDAAFFDALVKFRPVYCAGAGQLPEPFRAQAQVDLAAARVGFVAFKQLWTFGVLRLDVGSLAQLAYGSLRNDPTTVTFDALFATWLAQNLLGRPAAPTGLSEDDLRALPGLLRDRPWGTDPVGHFEGVIGPAIEALGPNAARMVSRWLNATLQRLVDELADVEHVDPAIVQAVVLIAR